MTGLLCLSWNNHKQAFSKLLTDLYMQDAYSDGTIMCQGKFYPVHQFVLSTCSEYFEEVFHRCVQLNNKHPFIFVKDINSAQMEALLNYMYKGEVNVPQEMLPELIRAAEAFKIKGLAVPDNLLSKRRFSDNTFRFPASKKIKHDGSDSDSNVEIKESESTNFADNIEQTRQSPLKCDLMSPEASNSTAGELNPLTVPVTENSASLQTLEIKAEPLDFNELNAGLWDDAKKKFDSYKFQNNFEVFDGKDLNFDNFNSSNVFSDLPLETGLFQSKTAVSGILDTRKYYMPTNGTCPFPGCTYVSESTASMRVHIRIHTGEKPYKCSQCSYEASVQGNISLHMKSVHLNEKPFKCSLCPYRSAIKGNLKIHVRGVHASDKNFKCFRCPYKSSRKHNLALHMVCRHADLNND